MCCWTTTLIQSTVLVEGRHYQGIWFSLDRICVLPARHHISVEKRGMIEAGRAVERNVGACGGPTLPRNLIQSWSHMCTVGTTSYQSRKVRNDRGWAGGWTQWIVGELPFFERHWWRWMYDEVNCTSLQNIYSKHIVDTIILGKCIAFLLKNQIISN